MLKLNRVHHIAIICADYQKSKHFYTEILGLNIVREVYREERQSYKLDLEVGNLYQIELFSFPEPPARPSRPEAVGLRHLAFEVDALDEAIAHLNNFAVETEPIRIDEFTGKRFTFFTDPDGLPLELYEK
ncbi:MAG: VOC family protein [Mucilaginibacter sp.]|uniref:SMU1112c/YaeR family gloxylase I-like metalloprotein n=1 Tax=Mucilaginibacter sp. TaxID=1882438 RepID=UPI0031A31F27